MRCSKCGIALPDDSVFCSGCGAKIKRNVVVCQKCGAELPAGSEFCNRCGTAVFKAVPKKTDSVRENCPSCGISLSSEQKYCPKCKERNPIYIKSNKQGKKSGSRKKLIGWLSAAAGLLAIAAIVVFGFIIPEGHYEFYYEMINDGEDYAITGYAGNDSDVVIPKTIWWKPVKIIAGYAFQNRDDITNVTINADIAGIGVSAFEGCDSLLSVTIGDSKGTSDESNGVIMEGAFKSCNKLKSVTFKGSRRYSVLDDCFDNCNSLNTIDFKNYDGIRFYKIGERAFRYCHSLSSLNLSCEEIGGEAFLGCTGLVSATVNVPVIPEFCFENCSSLEKFVGQNIDTVGAYAFSNCTKLSEVIYEINENPVIFDTAYDGCPMMITEPEPEPKYQYNPYAGVNFIGMTVDEAVNILGYNYDICYMNGADGYYYDQYGLAIPFGYSSVNCDSIVYIEVYGDQYITSNMGAIDQVHIGMTFQELFDIVGELELSVEEINGGYICSMEYEGYRFVFCSDWFDVGPIARNEKIISCTIQKY